MIFEKEAITIQEEAEKIARGDRDGAPRNALYARKTSLCTSQPRRTKLAGTVYAEGLFAAAAQESARAWQTLWQQANITVTGDLMSQNFYGFTVITCWLRLRLLVTKRKHWTSRLPPEACMVKRIVDIFSGMKFLFYLFIFNIILTQRNNCCCTATTD